MGNFSKPPLDVLLANLARHYVGLHIEQGVPVLDRDLNLLGDLIATTLRNVIADYIGDGVAASSSGFAIESITADNDFRISAGVVGPGKCLVNGLQVTIDEPINYSAQSGLPELHTPEDGIRTDLVYLDVWLSEIGEDDAEYVDLGNTADVGMRTSVRLKPTWAVRVAEGISIPEPLPGHSRCPLAQLRRVEDAQIKEYMITDLRQTLSTLADVEQRLSNMTPSFRPVTPFTPKSGAIGTKVRIFGKNLNIGSIEVRFGNIVVSPESVETLSAEEILAKVPDNASGKVYIQVITATGSVVSEALFSVTE